MQHRSNDIVGVNVALAFNMGTDMEAILSSPIQQPLATVRLFLSFLWEREGSSDAIFQIFFNSFGQKGTLALWSFIVIAQ